MARTKDFVEAMKEEKAERKVKKELKRKAAEEEATEAGVQDEVPVSESKKSKKPKAASTTQDSEAANSTKNSEAEGIDSSSIQPPNKKRKVSLPSEIEVDITLPEPPSRKALRGLKKGKPLPPPKTGDNSEDEETPAAKTPKVEVEKRSEHGVWIGNLPWSVTLADLRKFFIDNSEIIEDSHITRVHMPGPDDGKPANKVQQAPAWKKQHNKGYAYVDFRTEEAATSAVELSELLLQGRRVLIKNNKSFEGRPLKTKEESRAEGKAPSKRIFVGNLRFDATEESLKEHFEQCGPIETIMVATFEDSGKCKGYGWITFEELSAAEAAVRGWVQMPEEEEPNFEDDDAASVSSETPAEEPALEADSDESEVDEEVDITVTKPKKTPRPIIRKRFIDRILGRPIRREFAEAPQVRYKKRYGKDGTKAKAAGLSVDMTESGENGTSAEKPHRNVTDEAGKIRKVKEVKYRTEYAPRLTGGIIESEGKKVVF